jgi:DNA ligase (NAD+)
LPPSEPARRIAELRERIHRALLAYHVDDEPVMSDAAYDALYDELVALERAHPGLVTLDSPTQRVGAPPSARFEKVRHLQPLGSLEKVTTEEAVLKWVDDVRASAATSPSRSCSSRRSTASRSTSPTRPARSRAARPEATASRART